MSNKEEEIRTEDWLGIMWSVVCGFKWWIVLMNIGFIWFDPSGIWIRFLTGGLKRSAKSLKKVLKEKLLKYNTGKYL
jgi:hypothetical protein